MSAFASKDTTAGEWIEEYEKIANSISETVDSHQRPAAKKAVARLDESLKKHEAEPTKFGVRFDVVT